MKTFQIMLLAASSLHAQNIAGDWHGTLQTGGAQLRIAVHILKDGDAFRGTMDSLDQGAKAIPFDFVSFQDSRLKFTIDASQASYDGKLDPGGNTVVGTWTQSGSPLPLRLERGNFPAPKPAKPSDIDGLWQGTLDAGMKVRLAFHLANMETGLAATMDSIDQGARGIPLTSAVRDGSSLKMELKAANAVFSGKISPDLATIDGTWTQGGNSLPLVLKRGTKEEAKIEHRRPQNPIKPYPYQEQEVTYENKSAGIKLAATLTIPKGKGPFPAVVLITGSGQQDRDETLLGHKPFLVLADYLTRKGIAVLRADDRGAGGSGGNFATSTTVDFATDTEAGIAYLKTRPEVNPRRIGLIGHSEGGLIAPMVAARNPDVAFIVMMAGPGVSGAQVLVKQQSLILAAGGMSAEKVEQYALHETELMAMVEQETDNAALARKAKEAFAGKIPEDQLNAQLKIYTSPWFRYFLAYDPAPALRKLKCPVLAIDGEKDLQVPPSQNLPAIRKALEAGGNKNFEVDELPGLNHLFQTAKTGSPGEYEDIEETISPVALEKIATWINRQPAPSNSARRSYSLDAYPHSDRANEFPD